MLRGPRVARSEGGALGGVAESPGVVVLGCDGDGPVIAPPGLCGVRLGFSVPGEVLSLGAVADGSFPDGPVIAPPGLWGVRFGFSEPDAVLSPGVVADGSFPDGPVIAPPELASPRDGRLGFSAPVALPFSPDGVEPAPLPGDPFDRSR